jgi:hypothetical protein
LKWSFNTTKIDEDKIFQLVPNKGVLLAGQQLDIKAIFNPYKSG